MFCLEGMEIQKEPIFINFWVHYILLIKIPPNLNLNRNKGINILQVYSFQESKLSPMSTL